MQEYNIFFHAYFNKVVTWSDRMEFVNGWYILIIVSDMLTISGSVLKIGIQTKVSFSIELSNLHCLVLKWIINMNFFNICLIFSGSFWQTMMSAASC